MAALGSPLTASSLWHRSHQRLGRQEGIPSSSGIVPSCVCSQGRLSFSIQNALNNSRHRRTREGARVPSSGLSSSHNRLLSRRTRQSHHVLRSSSNDSKEASDSKGGVGTEAKEEKRDDDTQPEPPNSHEISDEAVQQSSDLSASDTKPKPSPESPGTPPPPQPSTAQFQSISVSDLLGPEKVDAEDVKRFREKLCGLSTFFVTGQEPFGQTGEGVLLLGNMRGQKEDVYAKLQAGTSLLFGEKYSLFMVQEPARDSDPGGGKEELRVSFVLMRREAVMAPSPGAWQYVIALVLLGVTAGACLELGLATQISRVPPDVIQYFTDPTPHGDPPALETLSPFVRDALPVAQGVLGVQALHELGHYLAATQRKVKLGIPFLIPNITIGTFGSITNFRSPCPDRTAKFDVSVAGPVAGGALSLAMFLTGLALTASASVAGAAPLGPPDSLEAGIQVLAAADMVQVPSLLFQGSLLLGLVSRLALGYDALHAATVSIHPLLITGWCGLTVSALNLLPVGSLDGGRAMQAAFGRSPTMWAGTLTYLGLGLGLIGGTLSLPFGLYVLLLQRSMEKPALNDVTEISGWRKAALGVLLALSFGILLPVWNELAADTGIGLETVGSIVEF